jgi:hypothetical protein
MLKTTTACCFWWYSVSGQKMRVTKNGCNERERWVRKKKIKMENLCRWNGGKRRVTKIISQSLQKHFLIFHQNRIFVKMGRWKRWKASRKG